VEDDSMTDREGTGRERDDVDPADSGATPEEGGDAKGRQRNAERPELAGRATDRNAVVHWLLVSGDRRRMVWGLSLAATVLFVLADFAGVVGITSANLIATTFTSAITGVFTIVAVTVSINQLVLSRILGSPERIRERVDSVRDFRSRVEDMDPDVAVTPTMPAAFLRELVETLHERTDELDATYRSREGDADAASSVPELAGTLRTICEQVEDDLEDPDLSMFRVLAPILTNEFSLHLHSAYEVRATTDLSTAESQALDRVVEAIDELTVTRHYFKTLYIHGELATVSRMILLTGLPAVLVSIGVILLYSRDSISLADPVLLVVVSVALGVVLLPLNVLFAYGLRMGTIAKMTTTFGTFTPVDEMP
jgi:hypothetical protein